MPALLDPRSILDVDVRVHAELGRTRMPLARAVALADGSIVDLDQAPETPLDLFVNGRRLGTGRLVVVDGEWGVRLETVDLEVAVPVPATSVPVTEKEAAAGDVLAGMAAGEPVGPAATAEPEELPPTPEEFAAMAPYMKREARAKWGDDVGKVTTPPAPAPAPEVAAPAAAAEPDERPPTPEEFAAMAPYMKREARAKWGDDVGKVTTPPAPAAAPAPEDAASVPAPELTEPAAVDENVPPTYDELTAMPPYLRREAREQWPHLFDEAGKPIAPGSSSGS